MGEEGLRVHVQRTVVVAAVQPTGDGAAVDGREPTPGEAQGLLRRPAGAADFAPPAPAGGTRHFLLAGLLRGVASNVLGFSFGLGRAAIAAEAGESLAAAGHVDATALAHVTVDHHVGVLTHGSLPSSRPCAEPSHPRLPAGG
ncbi:hypothetical protein G6F32_015675 [Rhizopus arrhizus]|nr:hypothetical protein G6F32_015675 [Rhizopus arrhizus]